MSSLDPWNRNQKLFVRNGNHCYPIQNFHFGNRDCRDDRSQNDDVVLHVLLWNVRELGEQRCLKIFRISENFNSAKSTDIFLSQYSWSVNFSLENAIGTVRKRVLLTKEAENGC